MRVSRRSVCGATIVRAVARKRGRATRLTHRLRIAAWRTMLAAAPKISTRAILSMMEDAKK